jgi:hypothetical protein
MRLSSPSAKRLSRRRCLACDSERGHAESSFDNLVMRSTTSVTHQFHEAHQDRKVQVSISIFIFRFSPRKSRFPFPFPDLYLSYRYRSLVVRSPLPFAASVQHFRPVVWNSDACIHSSTLTARMMRRLLTFYSPHSILVSQTVARSLAHRHLRLSA